MDDILAYIFLTLGLIVLQIRDNIVLYRTGDKPAEIDWAFNLLEFLWVFASIAVLFNETLTTRESIISIAYISYNIIGWMIGFYLYKDVDVSEISVFAIPEKYIEFCLAFCVLFFIYATFTAIHTFPFRTETSVENYFLSNPSTIFWIVAIMLLLKSFWTRFFKFSNDTFQSQVNAAIGANNICNEYFGKILKIELDEEETAEYEKNIFAYHVTGEENYGLLIAEFFSEDQDTEVITDGIIECPDGTSIELESLSLHA